ncbi:MAG: hypothetical protein HY862_07940 [Chloroflexi bacterium]|nr:hypothetical protein [Chloroflexota bacterium]
MDDLLLLPPIAFVIYLGLVGALSLIGQWLAPEKASANKSSIYASGEAPSTRPAVPGYRPFFIVALFFAVVHLGVLVAGSSDLTAVAGIFLAGVMVSLLALILE